MRLLNIRTKKLEEFFDDEIPPYAILSHVWGKDEVLFSHIRRKGYKGGSFKVDGCLAQAADDGMEYVWIDPLCIDKSSSAELSEAINSMFQWYRASQVCYAYMYLEDVFNDSKPYAWDNVRTSNFGRSRWFARGWTLQELLAPDDVQFFSSSWDSIGRKKKLAHFEDYKQDTFYRILSIITRIPASCLDVYSDDFRRASIAQRMNWAAGRSTTRKEDRAYSLLGLFDVNMPMLYGEGDKAFIRLQEEILRVSHDQSLLVWGFGQDHMKSNNRGGLFAASPDDFAQAGNVLSGHVGRHYTMTNKGLHMVLRISNNLQSSWSFLTPLHCSGYHLGEEMLVALPLYYDGMTLYRDVTRRPTHVPLDYAASSADNEPRYVQRQLPTSSLYECTPGFSLVTRRWGFDPQTGIKEVYPARWTAAFKGGSTVPWLTRKGGFYTHREVILFRYGGGGISSFIAKMAYEFTIQRGSTWEQDGLARMKPKSLKVWVAWFPKTEHSLESMILQEHSSGCDRRSALLDTPCSPDQGWFNVLDNVLEWEEYFLGDSVQNSVAPEVEKQHHHPPSRSVHNGDWTVYFDVSSPGKWVNRGTAELVIPDKIQTAEPSEQPKSTASSLSLWSEVAKPTTAIGTEPSLWYPAGTISHMDHQKTMDDADGVRTNYRPSPLYPTWQRT